MRFYVNPGDGASARMAQTISFVGDSGVTWILAAGYEGLRLIRGDGEVVAQEATINRAAEIVAGLLFRHQDQSLVVEAGPGTVLRGNEESAADVFPPHRHPRINVEG